MENTLTINKLGGLASFLLALSLVVAPAIYLVGNLREANGVLAYSLADLLHGPVQSASLIGMTYVLRDRLGPRATRRMDLALVAAALSAAGMAAVAFVRSANRGYHLLHPELALEHSTTVLVVWTTLIAGLGGLGFHFLGWAFLLLGSASRTWSIYPRGLSSLYLAAGAPALFVYLIPELEGLVILLGTIMGVWQGAWLWTLDARLTPGAS